MAQASSSFASSPAKPKKKSRVIWFVLLGVVIMAGLVGAAAYKKSSSKKGVLVTTEKAVVKTITQLVSATGKIQPETEVKISPEVAGEIVELPFREGATVKKGDLLIKVKPDNYQAQVEQREADLAAARATSVQNQAQLAKAEEDFKRTQDVFSKNIVTESDFTAARTNAEVAGESCQLVHLFK